MQKISIPGGFYWTLAVITVFFVMVWLVMFQRVVAEFAMLGPVPFHRADFRAGAFSHGVNRTIVAYNEAGFSPFSITIEKGTVVVFENKGSYAFWPASASHPAHDGYSEEGGCGGSAFDACGEIQPGESWSFKFDVAGTWRYHNHLEPGDTGTIVVE